MIYGAKMVKIWRVNSFTLFTELIFEEFKELRIWC